MLASQFTGSKGQWRYSTDMWGAERNLLSEEQDEKNTMTIRNLKHRADGGKTGKTCKLHYNEDTGRLEEKTSRFSPVVPPKVQQPAPAPSMPALGVKFNVKPNNTSTNKPNNIPSEEDDDSSLANMMGG